MMKILVLLLNRGNRRIKNRLYSDSASKKNRNTRVEFCLDDRSNNEKKRDQARVNIVAMSVPNPNAVVTACINAPDDAEGKAELGESIQTKGASTTYVTITPSLLTDLTPLIKAVRDAKTEAEAVLAWYNLNKGLKKIMSPVQDYMDLHHDLSVVVCEHYGFHVRGKGGNHEQVFSGESGVSTGEIDLILPKGPDGSAYDLKLWNADRTAFTRAQPTDVTHVTVAGLVSGAMQNVSVAEIRHGVKVRESDIIAVRVK